jgi:hypothetical protein
LLHLPGTSGAKIPLVFFRPGPNLNGNRQLPNRPRGPPSHDQRTPASRPPAPARAGKSAERAAAQDRGQKRIEELLDAAEQVIVEVGIDG